MNVHVIIGTDEYLVGEAAKKFVGDGVGLEVIDSLEATNCETQLRDIGRVRSSLMTPPFLEPRKITWWKNVNFLPHGEKLAEDTKDALEAFAGFLSELKLPDSHCFVLTGSALRKDSIFAKKLAGSCEMIVFGQLKPKEAGRQTALRAAEFAAELGMKFAPGAAEAFAAKVADDARTQKSEVAKLRDYLGKSRDAITVKDVDEIVSRGAEPVPWEVTDALGARDAGRAIAAMRRFQGDSGYAVFMTTVIEKYFRELAEAKDAIARGRGSEAFSGKPSWMASRITGVLGKWTLRELRVARFRFLQLRERSVTSSDGIEPLIDAEVVRTLS